MSARNRVAVAVALASAATLTVTASLTLGAAQAPPAQGAAPRPLIPMTASSILRNPASHLGENVSMMASVEAVLTKTVFTVDQDKTKATGQEVLVIAPSLNSAPDLNAYVTVQGEVFTFNPAEVAKRAKGYTLDLSPELIARYQGKPAVLATAVVSPALVDLARRLPRPMSPDDITLRGHMTAINPAFTAVRTGLESPNAAELKDQVAILKKNFGDVETFFKTRGPAEAAKMAAESLKLATSMEAALASGKLDEIKTAAGGMQQLCAGCHTPYRERMEDGTYRIRIGGGQ